MLLSIAGDTEVVTVTLHIVRQKKDKLSDGDMHIVWKKSTEIFGAKTDTSELILKNKYTNYRLINSKANPEIWVTTLEDVTFQYNN